MERISEALFSFFVLLVGLVLAFALDGCSRPVYTHAQSWQPICVESVEMVLRSNKDEDMQVKTYDCKAWLTERGVERAFVPPPVEPKAPIKAKVQPERELNL